MEFSEALSATQITNHIKIRQPRLWILCGFYLPDAVAETRSAIDVAKVRGQFLLGFNFPPKLGECFPYEGHIWRVKGEPIQFPTRYRSKSRKESPFVACEYLESYSDEMQMFTRLLELSTNI
ncbi:MAG: hypothetical protein KME18_07650 [Phormidium tanganyikae FI6-MK23]|jgi:hypothetical protein|nr:hypothetical protein [Phormidium tanganyikae FI6-MK23]